MDGCASGNVVNFIAFQNAFLSWGALFLDNWGDVQDKRRLTPCIFGALDATMPAGNKSTSKCLAAEKDSMAIEKAKPRRKPPAAPNTLGAGKPEERKPRLIAQGSGAAIAALVFGAACLAGYAVTQYTSRDGLAGEVQRQWRSGILGSSAPGALAYASGDIEGLTVSDPQFALTARAAVIERTVSTYQWVEDCSKGPCVVSMGWRDGVLDASAFKEKGRVNLPPRYQSMAMAGRIKVGSSSLSASAARELGPLGRPYPVGQADAEIAGLAKVDGGYQNFNGEPKLGDFRVTWKALAIGAPVTVVGERDLSGDIAATNYKRFAAREGALKPAEFIGLNFWELPEFGWVLLGLSVISFVAGAGGIVAARRFEGQILRQGTDEASGLGAGAPNSSKENVGRGLAKPKEYKAAAERRARMEATARDERRLG